MSIQDAASAARSETRHAAGRRLSALFISFEGKAFFDPRLHEALAAEAAPPVIGLNRRVVDAPDAVARAVSRVRDALADGGGPLVVAVEGTLLVGRGELAFRLPQGRLFTGRRLRALIDAAGAPSVLLILDCTLIRDRAPTDLDAAYAEALARAFGDAHGDSDIVCLARAPSDATPLAPRLAAAWASAAAAARARRGAEDVPAWIELADLTARLPGPGAHPIVEPDLPALATLVGASADQAPTGDGLDAKGRIILAGHVLSTTDLAIPAAPRAAFDAASSAVFDAAADADPDAVGAAPEPSVALEAAAPASVGEAVDALLHHTVPKAMRVRRAYDVEVALSKDLTGAAGVDLGPHVTTENVAATALMAVRLVDERGAFEIQSASQPIQDIDLSAARALGLKSGDGPARGLWRFRVTPTRVGAHPLGIEAACYVPGPGGAPIQVPSGVNRISVRVTVNLGRGLARVASWLLMGALGVVVFKFGVELPLEQALADAGGWAGLVERLTSERD